MLLVELIGKGVNLTDEGSRAFMPADTLTRTHIDRSADEYPNVSYDCSTPGSPDRLSSQLQASVYDILRCRGGRP